MTLNRLHLPPLPDHPPEIGRWLAALEEARGRTLRLVDGMSQRVLDAQGDDGRDNAVGSLLYHLALVELSWLYLDLFETELPDAVRADFPHPMGTEGRITPVLGVSLDEHVARLARSRERFLREFRRIDLDDWTRPRAPAGTGYEVTPAWAVFHLLEHEATHAGQIAVIVARAARAE